jgi:hypothetical protein
MQVSLLSRTGFSPQRRKGRREEFFYLAVRGRQIKKASVFGDLTLKNANGHEEV